MKRNLIKLFLLMAVIFCFNTGSIQAAFDKNNVISDAVFDDYTTMSSSVIQDFLNKFPNSCLKDYKAAYPEGYNDYGEKVSAAKVIRRAAYIYDVNPQVILATLQKESSLVTGNDGCASWRYKSAMGMGCPDGGECPAPGYEGFSKQVTKGTWLLKFGKERSNGNVSWEANDGVGGDFEHSYSGPMTEGCHKRNIGSAVVCYDGYTTIDGQSVYVTTGATGSFYNYTPHLHGNQLFVSIFEDWFGPTTNIKYRAQTYMRCCHIYSMRQNTEYADMWFENTGNITWYDEQGLDDAPPGTRSVRLYASRDIGRSSIFGKYWNSNRTVAAYSFSAVYENDGTTLADNQHSVEPGQIAAYENITFRIQDNSPFGMHKEFLQPSLKGKPKAFNDPGAFLNIHVEKPTYKASTYFRCCHIYSERQNTEYGELWFKNTGNMPWYDHTGIISAPPGTKEVRLYTAREVARESIFGKYWNNSHNVPAYDFSAVYESDGTTLAINQHMAHPGQIVQYEGIPFRIPDNAPYGVHKEFFMPSLFRDPYAFNDPGAFLNIHVEKN